MASEGKEGAGASGSTAPAKRFEVKKWNAVALWAWGTYSYARNLFNRGLSVPRIEDLHPIFIELLPPQRDGLHHADIQVDNCAICRNHIMDLCKYAPVSCVTPANGANAVNQSN